MKRKYESKRIKIPNEWADHGYTEEQWWELPSNKRWRLRNPEKHNAAVRKWAAKQEPDTLRIRARKYQLQFSYGIDEAEYERLLKTQDNKCAICGTDKPTGKWKVFAVDHCHVTGKVRGLLCNECNRGMGLLKDSPDILQKAINYLTK